MAKNQNLELALKIKALVDGVNNVKGLADDVRDLQQQSGKPIQDPTPALRDGATKTTGTLKDLKKELAGVISLAAIQQFVNNSVQEFARAEMAFRGLESVANFTGVGIAKAMEVAGRLSAHGLMTTAEASKALQNLLSRGYNIDQAEQTLVRLRDAAYYGRSAHLSLGEAVVSASEGLKNENSILVDNAGVTKNVSVLWKEYAASIGKSVTELTQAEKVEAEHAGIMRETAAQAGNSTKAMDDYQHQIAEANAEQRKFAASLGQILAPAMSGLRQIGTWLIENIAKPAVVSIQALAVAAAGASVNIGLIWDAIRKGKFDGLWGRLKENIEHTFESIGDLPDQLDKLDFEPLGEGAKKAAADTGEAAAQMAKDAKALAKERKDSVNEQIADYERLRTELIKAFDGSLKAERDYRAQAKKLRAEAAAVRSDGSVEAEASAMLALIVAEQQLQRIKGSAPLEDVQAQAEQVRQLAANLDDQARATEAVNRAKMAEADALERAADAEREQQSAITEQQRQNEARIVSLQALLKDLESGKTVKVDADTGDATSAVEKFKYLIDSIKDKSITLGVNQTGAAAGAIPGYATGTVLPGYGGGDRRLILAEDGEAITRKEAVAYYGRSFMAQLNRMQIPRFQSGGFVDRVAAVSPAGSGLHPVTLNMPGGGSYSMAATPDVVGQLRDAIARESLMRGRRG